VYKQFKHSDHWQVIVIVCN